jgi:hypothetical protein
VGRIGYLVSVIGILVGMFVSAFAIYADANNGCENGPCGSPLVLVIPGALIVASFAALGFHQVRKRRRSEPRTK